ncbi:MAG: competence/damage-inducible protein A [bacterium]|nr:competence/damage-inducible protein A [bacterium]
MRATIIAVGSELLGADRSDTNSLFLADQLARYGIEVARKVIVGDRLEDIQVELDRSRDEAALVLVTGGLGPTRDDLTREAVARSLGRRLVRDPEIIEDIQRKFASFGREMAPVNERQADVIDGAQVLENRRGTAPGLRIEDAHATLFLFPGVPTELHGLVERTLVPWLESHAPGGGFERRVFKVACIPESDLEERLESLYARFGNEGVSLLPSPGEVMVGLTRGGSPDERAVWFEPRERLLEQLLGDHVFGRAEEALLEAEVGRLLDKGGKTVATAESCTGGGVAERLTAVPGSSAYFLGAAVTYSNELKASLLGVPRRVIDDHGAVSSQVAQAMALGVRARLGSDFGLAVTGIAGPGGGSEEKPVGTVHVALAGDDEPKTVERRFQFPGNRARVRRLTTQWALDLLRRRLLGAEASAQGQPVDGDARDVG